MPLTLDALKKLVEESTLEYLEDELSKNNLMEDQVANIASIVRAITTSSKTEPELDSRISDLQSKYPSLVQKITEEVGKFKDYE